MKISDIITKYYTEFRSMIHNHDVTVGNGNTMEDIFQNVIYTALKKYNDKDIPEEEGYSYIKKTLLSEAFFSWKRKGRDILVLTDNLQGV